MFYMFWLWDIVGSVLGMPKQSIHFALKAQIGLYYQTRNQNIFDIGT